MSLGPHGRHEPWREARGERDTAPAKTVLSKERENREEVARPLSVPPSLAHQSPECASHWNLTRNQRLWEPG